MTESEDKGKSEKTTKQSRPRPHPEWDNIPILDRAETCRIFLSWHNFITETENNNIKRRIVNQRNSQTKPTKKPGKKKGTSNG